MQQDQKYFRLAHIVARLKTGENMGLPELQKSLQSLEKSEGIRLECGIATIQRDVRDLKRMGCPIVYHRSPTRQSYELKDKSWELHSAPLMGGDEMLTVVLGAQFGMAFLPKAEAAKVSAVAQGIFRTNSENFLKTVDMNSMKLLMPPMSREAEATFSVLFEAWKQRRMASIKYGDEGGQVTERTIEPQALLFHNMAWYICAFCHLRNGKRTFAVTRILSVTVLDRTFENRPELYSNLTFDTFDDRSLLKDIAIRLTPQGRQFALTHVLHSQQRITAGEAGTFTLTVPSKAKHLAVEWILAQWGNAKALAPAELVEEVKNTCRFILQEAGDNNV